MKKIGRLRGAFGVFLMLIFFPVPLFSALNKLPWRWIADEYHDWYESLEYCWFIFLGKEKSNGRLKRGRTARG